MKMEAFYFFAVFACLIGGNVCTVPIPKGCTVFGFALNGFHHLPLPINARTIIPPLFGRRFILNNPLPKLNLSGINFGNLHINMTGIFQASTQLVYDSIKPTLPRTKEVQHTCRIDMDTTSQKTLDFVRAMMTKYKVCTMCDNFDTNETTCNTIGFCPITSKCYSGQSNDRHYWPKTSVYSFYDAAHPKAGYHGCCLSTDHNCRYHRYIVKNKKNQHLNTANYTIKTCTTFACNGGDSNKITTLLGRLQDGRWAAWGSWGQCSRTCDTGTKHRTRTCTNPKPTGTGKPCVGSSSSTTYCHGPTCPVNGHWTSWTVWGSCSVTCGDGIKSRTRTCTHPAPSHGGKTCVGSSGANTTCSLTACPIDGHWSGWGHWGSCSVTCGGGTKSRHRSCSHPAPSNGGKTCSGSSHVSASCGTTHCPVDGHWHSWQPWGACSVTCGHGTKTRVRTCTSVLYGGHTCTGNSQSGATCGSPCSVDGHWSTWNSWGKCSVTCGHGKETRGRTCSNPAPAYGGKDCAGDLTDERQCGQPCQVDGHWSMWQSWGTCSVTCGSGKESRARTCSNPKPAHGGKNCVGDSSASRTCGKPCIVDGSWSVWQAWGTCSKTCGDGLQSRARACSNPAPANGGKTCAGDSSQSRHCGDPCVVDGQWSAWRSWGTCSKTCGNGLQSRARACSNPAPANGGKTCAGDSSQSRHCGDPCKVDGHWTSWTSWGTCSVTCGDGKETRTRTCTNPAPAHGGHTCAGSASDDRHCGQPCVVDGHWTKWHEWSTCSKSCASGTRSRVRTCTNPAPANGGTDCSGSKTVTENCNTDRCPEWSRWFYDACSVTCGNGTTMRLRHCSSGKDSDCGVGKAFENVPCQEKPCPVNGAWSTWNAWSTCTATCGEGLHKRSRSCDHPAPQYGGADCNGLSDETEACNTQECAHWLPFQEVSPCSVTCGKGFKQMKRTCSTGVVSDCTGSAFTEETCILKECA